MERYFLIIIKIIICFSFISCKNIDAHLSVTKGNYEFYRGEYQAANIEYLSTAEQNVSPEVISYNLANVYYVLGEADAAKEEWVKALKTDNTELLYRVIYNQGILYYELGQYDNAYNAFKKSLEINPACINAKINLEFSLGKISAKGASSARIIPAETTVSKRDSNNAKRILEYVKRREEGKWESSKGDHSADKENDW